VNGLAIRVEGLGKEYHIGRLRPGVRTFRETLVDGLLRPVRRLRTAVRPRHGHEVEPEHRIWALRDVSFDVKQGEVVGIIGRNGAGKSTLLKILSRITEPTTGTVDIHGRVGSLLEVGTGFHHELTGRENIFLNGAILGMRRREIAQRFDDIVSFAEVERFIDTPVKRYSTGMYLRLAFAVAAHLESEILIVDEVLAVGDQVFQRKCLAKIEAMSRTGRTVFFVSHNMGTIERLCDRCLLFREGRLVARGEPAEIVAQYQAAAVNLTASSDLRSRPGRVHGSVPLITDVTLLNEVGDATACLRMHEGLSIHVGVSSASAPIRPVLGVVVKTALGVPLFGVNNRSTSSAQRSEAVTEGVITCRFASLPLLPGKYLLDLYCGDARHDLDVVHEAISFEVVPADVASPGLLPPRMAGPIFVPATFEVSNGYACRV
jgi:lipopolysaccharide transport system ATP-binding protein